MAKKRTRVVRIVLVGAGGRMGLAIKAVVAREFKGEFTLVGEISRGETSSFARAVAEADVVLDVSTPAATEKYLKELSAKSARVPYVIGCTGWTEAQLKSVHAYAKRAPVVLAPNFSPGVNLFLSLVEQAAPHLGKWGYDVSVHETHHTRKVDSPSGTAKAIVARLGNVPAQVHATRAGNVVGTHEVRFVGPGDIITLNHEALDRSIFARGAMIAAGWAAAQPGAGLFSMKEVIFGR